MPTKRLRKQKRKLNYYSNIYVVKDSANPQNEGKVFLYRYGKKIFDKIMEAMQPAFEDEQPVNPFDLWKGADFKLKITKVAGYWNYDKSEFDRTSTLGDFDDDDLEKIWKKEYSLTAYTADDQFKTYEELKSRLDSVLTSTRRSVVDESLRMSLKDVVLSLLVSSQRHLKQTSMHQTSRLSPLLLMKMTRCPTSPNWHRRTDD